MRIFLTILFILLPSIAKAENWVCYDQTTMEITSTAQGDCLTLGLCSGFNNTGLNPSCFEATKEELTKALGGYVKFDANSKVRVVDMTQQEKDAKDKPGKDAAKAYKDSLNSIRTKLKGMGLSDDEIDIIVNN